MSQKSLVAAPPRGLVRVLLRLPNLLYRLGLGWLLGERFVLLNHVGRKSGQLRRTVIEVVGHDMESDTYFIVSGWGYKAQWYQNLLANPDITIQVGRRKLPVRAATLTPKEGAGVLLDYRRKHRFAARELSRIIGLDIAASSPNELEETVRKSLPVVALQPRSVSR